MQNTTQRPAEASGIFTIGGDLKVYRLGFGTMRLTSEGIWGPPANKQEAIAVLRRALELGINLIDTADSYGPEVSENLIAEALYPYPKDLVIATKGGFVRPGPFQWVPDGRPQHLREALEGSLRRLRLDHIDIYQLHCPDPEVPYEISVGELAKMREEGKIRHVGISNVTASQLALAQTIVPIVTVQNRYNLVDRSDEAMVDSCAHQGIGYIPWAPLATGELARQGGPLDQVAKRHAVLERHRHRRREGVHEARNGAAFLGHLQEDLAGLAVRVQPDGDVALVAGNVELVGDRGSLRREPAAI